MLTGQIITKVALRFLAWASRHPETPYSGESGRDQPPAVAGGVSDFRRVLSSGPSPRPLRLQLMRGSLDLVSSVREVRLVRAAGAAGTSGVAMNGEIVVGDLILVTTWATSR